MTKKKIKIAFFTSTRAEYGVFRWIIKEVYKKYSTHVIVGGTHLSIIDGHTIDEIKDDGIQNLIELPFLSVARTCNALTSSVGTGLIQMSQILDNLKPDLMFVLGDRYELFIPVISSIMYNVPIIHIGGGDVTEGVIDEQVRHAITKSAHIHMPATEPSAETISKMGEEDWRIFVIGEPGIENIKRLNLYSKKEISELLGIDLDKPTVICTYHPVTLEGKKNVEQQVDNLLTALSNFDFQIIFTRPNAEVGSDKVINKIQRFVAKNNNAFFFDSLGTRLYLSLMKYAKVIVGNSSSGIVEAPSFGIPTVDIGDRQSGRFRAKSVIHVDYTSDEIQKGIEKALHDEKFLNSIKNQRNPYGDGNTSKYVLKALEQITKIPKEKLLKKKIDFEVRPNERHKFF